MYFKREDKFSPSTFGVNGAKMRQCLFLVDRWVRERNIKGVVSGAVAGSPQHPFISSICNHYDIDCVIFSGSDDIEKNNYLKIANDLGATIIKSSVGYAKTLQSKSVSFLKEHPDYALLETNITLDDKMNTPESIRDFHSIGAFQVQNIPDNIETLIIPAGSCNSITSVLYGLYLYPPKSLKDILVMGIGNNGSNNLSYIPNRLKIISQFHGERIDELFGFFNKNAKYNIIHHNLNGSGYCKYSDLMPFRLGGIDFHPRYEGKIMNYINDYPEKFLDHINENTLFWIVGGKI